MYGSKKIFAKIMNGKLIIRVGGGYMLIDEFLKNYAEVEKEKMRDRGLIPEEYDDGMNSTPAKKGRGSPNNRMSKSPGGRT
jgi:Growth-Arrest-Specific Protein 2 Domain